MLTREQIDWFDAIATTLPRSCDETLPAFMLSLGLVNVGIGDRWVLTSAGHDLLATIPHLPAPEPEPAPPSCSRCGGETEVPLFMGPLMMPCPSCSNDDGSPKHVAHTTVDDEVIDASYTIDVGPSDHPPGDGWVLVTDEATAKPFAGQTVQVWGMSNRGSWRPRETDGTVLSVTSCGTRGMDLMGHDLAYVLSWDDGGSAYFRPVAE